jgi:hypothetical protein
MDIQIMLCVRSALLGLIRRRVRVVPTTSLSLKGYVTMSPRIAQILRYPMELGIRLV